MRQIVYSQRLGGRLTPVAPGVLDASLAGIAEAATVDAQLSFADERSFQLTGEIRLEGEGTLRFRSLGSGRLDPSPEPGLRHGTAVLEVCSGTGRFDGAHGRITSNFVVSDDGEITDHQLGVVFVAMQSKEEP
ncbi:MAG: hypothetical protein ACRDM7_12400 [Thermoleophilaceae bacterium]